MIYEPAIYNEHEWQQVDYLLLSDPILYTWMYWVTQDAREGLYTPLELRRKSWDMQHYEPIDFIRWRVIDTGKHTFTYPVI